MADQSKTQPGTPTAKAADASAPPAPSSTSTPPAASASPQAVVVPKSPGAIGADPMQLLLDLVIGLEEVARGEASQQKPASAAWGRLQRRLEAHLEQMGVSLKPRTAPQNLPTRGPLPPSSLGTRAPLAPRHPRPATKRPSGNRAPALVRR
jgi:hypothetical protein